MACQSGLLKLRRLLLFWSTLLGLCTNAAYSQDKTPEIVRLLSEHLQEARQFDGSYLAAQASKEAAWQEYQRAVSALGVSVTASASTFYSDRTEESRTTAGLSDAARSLTGHQAAITLRRPLYRQREQKAVVQAAARFQAVAALADAADHELFGRVYIAWMEVLAARDFLQIAWDAVGRSVAIRTEVQSLVQAGEATIDQYGLEMAGERLRWAELSAAQSRLTLAEDRLTDLAGPDARVPRGLTLEAAIPQPMPELARDQLFSAVEERNPELQSARFNEEAARLEREKRAAEGRPVVDLYASVSMGENDTASYIKDERRIGVQVSVPLYTSGGIAASVAQADAEYRKMQALTQATASRLKAQASLAYARVQTSLIQLAAGMAQIQATEMRAEAVHRGLLAGTMTTGDLSRAEADLLTARQQRLTEMLAFSQAWALLSVTTAQIAPAFHKKLALAP